MPFIAPVKRRFFRFRPFLLSLLCLLLSLLTLAQVTLRHRLLNGYVLSSDAPVNKGKPSLFVFEQDETFSRVFQPAPAGKRPDEPNFGREMVIGIALPPTGKPPQLSVSKVFVQDSMLTVRYIRMEDTTKSKPLQSVTTQPLLVLAVPRQTVLRTRLVENGKVVQTIRKRESE